MAVVVVSFDGCFVDRPVHPFYLPVGPRMLHPGEMVLDAVLVADAVEDVVEGVFVVVGVIGKLDAIVGQHDVEGVGYGRDKIAQELGGDDFAREMVAAGYRDPRIDHVTCDYLLEIIALAEPDGLFGMSPDWTDLSGAEKAAVVAEVRTKAGDRAVLPVPSIALIATARR